MKQIGGMWFPDGDQHFGAQLRVNPVIDGRGTYQHKKYIAALPHVRQRRHAVDIGGHVGLWARVMAMDFAKVTAFEPLPAHVECFERNLAGVEHVKLQAVALAEKAGELVIAMPGDNTGSAHVAPEGEMVRARTLDSFRLKDVDFIKIDVEGFEVPAIQGGEKTIRRDRPAIVVEQKPHGSAERYGRGRFDALDLLKSWGARQVWEIGGDFLLTWE